MPQPVELTEQEWDCEKSEFIDKLPRAYKSLVRSSQEVRTMFRFYSAKSPIEDAGQFSI